MTKRLLLIGILVFAACKKKEAAATEGSGSGSAPAPATMSAAPAAPTPAAPTPAAPPAAAAAGAIASAGDYTKKNDALQAKLVDLMKEKDCGKLGAAMATAFDANKDDILAVAAYEKAHPDDKSAYDKAHKAEMEKSMEPLMKCQNDPAVKAALAKMPE